MGCDIHVHGEILVRGRWLHSSNPSVDRHYSLFAKMAGVRNTQGIVPIAGPKGLPEDATESTLFDADTWVDDAHSHSWLGAKELGVLGDWLMKTHERGLYTVLDYPFFGCGWDSIIGLEGVEDVRIVFWFDN